MSRTDNEILDQTNKVALMILEFIGFSSMNDNKVYMSENPRAIGAWDLACRIQEELTETDPMNCEY